MAWDDEGWLPRNFVLRNGPTPVASILWEGLFTNCARLEVHGVAAWRAGMPDIFSSRVEVTPAGASRPVAWVTRESLALSHAATITISTGRRFLWKPPDFMASRTHLTAENGAWVLSLRNPDFFDAAFAHLEIAPDALPLVELPLLVALTGYVFVQYRSNERGTVADWAGP